MDFYRILMFNNVLDPLNYLSLAISSPGKYLNLKNFLPLKFFLTIENFLTRKFSLRVRVRLRVTASSRVKFTARVRLGIKHSSGLQFASGKSNDVSATLLTNIVLTLGLYLKFCMICIRSDCEVGP